MRDIYCIGELLIDFIGKERKNLENSSDFEKKAGGAPANVACAITRLGGKSHFLGQVGNDQFGKFLKKILLNEKVGTSMLLENGQTTLAFVSLDEKGERSFEFFKGSDQEYFLQQEDTEKFSKNSIIHFGSATAFLKGKLNESYELLFNHARAKNLFISFDPNFRDALIDTEEKLIYFKEESLKYIKNSNLLKLSREELTLLTEEENLDKALNFLHNIGGKVICITLGEEGTLLSRGDMRMIIPTVKIEQLDSTGAGDAFIGAVLFKLSNIQRIGELSDEEWNKIVIFANVVGALTCTNYGAIDSLPTLETVEKKLKKI